MVKSISKKILSFLLIALSSLAFAVPVLFGSPVALAQFENNYEERDYSIDELNARLDALKTDIATVKGQVGDKVTVDESDEIYNYLVTAITVEIGDSSADYNEIAERYLFGDTGLNGLYGIYESAYNFYNRYVAVDADGMTEVSLENGFTKDVNATLIEQAESYLSDNFNAKTYESQDYDKTLVDAKVSTFETVNVENAKAENEKQDQALAKEIAKINYYREIYFGVKYGNEYANQTLYASDVDVSEEKAQEVIDRIYAVYESEASFEVAMTKVATEIETYKQSLSVLKSALTRAYEEIVDDTTSSAIDLVVKSEEAFNAYNELGTIVYYEKNTDGTDILYSLKDLRPVESDKVVFEDDRKVALNLLNVYKQLIKDAVSDVALEKESDYGLSGGTLISKYRDYAKALADCLGECGLLPEEESAPVANYSAKKYTYGVYGEITVENGSDIVKAFEDSFTVFGALQVTDNGIVVRSESLEDKKLTSSVTVKDSAETPRYEVTLTCMDGENPVPFFDSGAVLRVREGATPSIERNINLLLKGDKLNEIAPDIDEATRATLKGKIVTYYFTVTVLEPNKLDGKPAVKEIENTGYDFILTVKFLDQTQLAEIKDKTSVIRYRHTTVEEVYDITWGDDYIMFNVTNFTNETQMALIATGNPTLDNIVTWGVYGLGGLVAGLFLIWILIAVIRSIVRNWKYKITFFAKGGRFNKRIKVKLHEKFNHPAPPRRKGYKFLGWFVDPKCTIKFAATELTKRKNIKVYAKWMSDAEYAKLEEKYAAASIVSGSAVIVDSKKDPQIEKIEAEKLGYEAKKAEEERKTEEVKLQAIREIEQAKKNEDALAKAEQDAKDAQDELDKTVAERDQLIKEARADERSKCIEELQAVSSNDDAKTAEEYEAAIAKAREEASAETEERVRKEYDAKADEQARINEDYANRIKALEDANEKAIADAKARDEEEARRQAEEEARINAAIAAGLAAKLAENATEEVEEEQVEEIVEEVEEETAPVFDTETVFDNIKAEIYSYTDADDLGYSLDANVPACAMKVVGETIELEVNLDLADCEKKGYKVTTGDKLPVKFVLTSDEDVDEAYELVEETMFVNGLKKTRKAVVTKATDETRANGFEYGISKDKVADTAEEFYKLLRVYTQSFVLADDGEVEEKALVKMFLARGKVYMFLNYTAEGLNACDEEMANEGYKTFMTVNNADDCRNAIKAISAMMKENGLIRYPSAVSVAGDDCKKGFTYRLSK